VCVCVCVCVEIKVALLPRGQRQNCEVPLHHVIHTPVPSLPPSVSTDEDISNTETRCRKEIATE